LDKPRSGVAHCRRQGGRRGGPSPQCVRRRPRTPTPDGGRAARLERFGLAEQIAPGCWTLKPGIEDKLRDLSIRSDIIKTMHRAMGGLDREPDISGFALQGDAPADTVIGRLVERGLHDELKGLAYAIVEGIDGRTHHVRFADIEMTGDAAPGAIVEARAYDDAQGRKHLTLATRSDLIIEAQVTAQGATWLDRQLIAKDSEVSSAGFGIATREAMERRIDHLVGEGLARRQGQRVIFARDLLNTLRRRDLDAAVSRLSIETGLLHRPYSEGEHIAGTYRQRLVLASGRFAMIDDGMGFQLVPWRPALERRLGQEVSGIATARGQVTWSLGRKLVWAFEAVISASRAGRRFQFIIAPVNSRLDRFLYADLSEHTTTAVERLPIRRGYLLLQATFLAARVPSTPTFIGCITQAQGPS
jgi:hypothetical protein